MKNSIKLYALLGILIFTFYLLGNIGVEKFKKKCKICASKSNI